MKSAFGRDHCFHHKFLVSVSPEHDNAFLVRLYKLNGHGVMDLFGETANFTKSLEAFDSAHRHCFVWKKNDNLKVITSMGFTSCRIHMEYVLCASVPCSQPPEDYMCHFAKLHTILFGNRCLYLWHQAALYSNSQNYYVRELTCEVFTISMFLFLLRSGFMTQGSLVCWS